MNIPTLKSTVGSLFDDEYFSHEQEMENLANNLYLEFKGARTGVITRNDPCEDTIIGISPKAMTMLMLGHLNLCFRPVPSHPLVGIMIAVPVSFGDFAVYSTKPNCWTKPTEPTEHLGFTMMFNRVPKSMAYLIDTRYKDIHVIPEESTECLVLGSMFNIKDETYLNDICDEVYTLLNTFSRLDDELWNKAHSTQ